MESVTDPLIPLRSTANKAGADKRVQILLDGVINRIAPSDHRFACCIGARIAIFEATGDLEIRQDVPLPTGGELYRLQMANDRLYVLLRDGHLLSRSEKGADDWTAFSPALEGILDVAVTDHWLFRLTRGRLFAAKLNTGGGVYEEIAVDVPLRAKHLCLASPYVAAFGPFALWIGLISSRGFQLIYAAMDKYQSPVAIARRKGEVVIADHLAGLIFLSESAGGELNWSRHDETILHPHAVAWDGKAWVLGTERGPVRWSDGSAIALDFGPDPITELHGIEGSLLVAGARRLLLLREGKVLSSFETSGYGYAATACEDVIACVTDSGIYSIPTTSESLSAPLKPVSLPGSARAVAVRPPISYVATTEGLLSFKLRQPSQTDFLCRMDGLGEPVSLAVDADGTRAYWSCGLSLRTVELEATGAMRVLNEIRLGVYPHAMAVAKEHLYIACGDGGLLYGETSSLDNLIPVSDFLFVADVAANDDFIAVATVKSLVILSHSNGNAPHPICRIDDQRDLAACTFDGETLIFVTGNLLFWAAIVASRAIHILDSIRLPFAPRRLNLCNGDVLAVGAGGLLIIKRGAR